MIFPETIFKYILQEETNYKTKEITLGENWNWNLYTHISLSFHLKYGKYLYSNNDLETKNPFHNIILPILEFRYAAEDRDVKDIVFETEEPEKQHLSFLLKKYWDDVFTVNNNLDDFIDTAVEEKVDFGGCLVKKGAGAVPEVIPLQSIAFCDQTDILGGAIGFKFSFSPEALKRKAKLGWGDKNKGADLTIDELIHLASKQHRKSNDQGSSGVVIDVYVVRGYLPAAYLEGHDMDTLVNQVQVVAFYTNEENQKEGVTLYKEKETENVLKFHTPKKIYGRGIGLGGVEAIMDEQIWANFAEIHKNNLLKAASKIVFYTDDENYANRSRIRDLDNLEITTIDPESRYGIRQVPNASPNIQLFNLRVQELEAHARKLAGVSNALLGEQPPAGTPFRLQERVVFQAKQPHERIAGKFDKFLEEIIQDWVVPHIIREITNGTEFLSTLSSDEMEYILRKVPHNRAVKRQWEEILNGKIPTDLAILEAEEREKLSKAGNKLILKILKDEFKNVKMKVKIRVSQKQKDLSLFVDKLVNVLRQYWTLPPDLRNDPVSLHLMNQIIEASGISPATLGNLTTPRIEPPLPPVSEQATRPVKELAEEKTIIE